MERRYWLSVLGVGLWLLVSACDRKPSKPQSAKAPSTAMAESAEKKSTLPPIIDVHVHASAQGLPRLDTLMKTHGVEHVVNLSGGSAMRGLREQLAAATSLPYRVSVFATMPYGLSRVRGYGALMAEDLRRAHAMGAKGYKIAKALGLGMVDADGQLVAVDDPELDEVFEAAGELDMPVAIHTGDPLRFWDAVTPDNERYSELSAHPGWSLHGRNVPSFDELYAALERRFARHPRTSFISVHFGNLAERPERVAQTLRKHPNVFIDTAARIPEMGRHDPELMRRFFNEFQDRILYGSDLGVGPAPSPLFLGSSGSTPPTPEEERRFFAASMRYFTTSDQDFPHPTPIQGSWTISGITLPRSILEKVFYKNAERLLKVKLRGTE